MSAAGRMRQIRDRPSAEYERRAAMAGVTVLLSAAALLLTTSQPATSKGQTTLSAQPKATTGHPGRAITGEAERVTRRFLNGYLGYVYGHDTVSRIQGATPALVGSLAARPPRVPPAARVRHPRVLSLHTTPTSAGRVVVRAIVNDGGLVDYPVTLTLATRHGRLLVGGLDGAR